MKPKLAEMIPQLALHQEMDTYVKAIMGKQTQQSSVSISKGVNFQWIQSLSIKRKANESDLMIELWYKDNFAGNDLKGSFSVDLLKTNVFLGGKPEFWFEIKDTDGNFIGKMLVQFEYKIISVKKKEV